MRILVHDFAGHSFQLQLSRELARRGHAVLHAYSPDVPAGKGDFGRNGAVGLDVAPVRLGRPFSRYSPAARLRDEVAYGVRVARLARSFSADLVLSGNTPLISQARLQRAARDSGAAFVFWLQDLLGVGVRAQLGKRVRTLGQLAGQLAECHEHRLLRRSDGVVAISEDFVPILDRTGVTAARISVIPNWAPLDELPLRPRRNAWSDHRGLSDCFVFLYSGTLGLKHDPEILVSLAARTQKLGLDVQVVVISEGSGAEYLREQRERRSLLNLLVLDYQPYEALPDVLATGDVLICVLERSAGIFSVPSKALSYLCSGRPILAAMPRDNLAARVLATSGGGHVVDPEDCEGFVRAALHLRSDEPARHAHAAHGRDYARRTFAIQAIADRFEQAFERAILCRASA